MTSGHPQSKWLNAVEFYIGVVPARTVKVKVMEPDKDAEGWISTETLKRAVVHTRL